MSDEQGKSFASARGLFTAVILGVGSVYLLQEILLRSATPAAVALALGAVLAAALPRPVDLRGISWSFFGPIVVSYGLVAGETVVAAVGGLAVGAFLFETHYVRRRSEKGGGPDG